MLRVMGEAPAEPGWRVVLGSGGASPYRGEPDTKGAKVAKEKTEIKLPLPL
jgi:hypothetical protein